MLDEIVSQIIRLAGTSYGLLGGIVAIVVLAVLYAVAKRAKITTAPPPPPYQAVDNAPPSDGSAPGDVHDAAPPPEMADPTVSHRPPENESGSGG